MLVLETRCDTDWKGRPDHRLTVIGEVATMEEATALVDSAVEKWMAIDISIDSDESGNQDFLDSLLKDKDIPLSKLWENNDRWEMQTDGKQRKFAEKFEDGSYSSIVYHLLSDGKTVKFGE